jgi:cytochrome P450
VATALGHLPGRDRLDELPRLLWDPTRFLHERFERYGRVFKTRLVYPCIFVVGEDANRALLVTKRAQFSFGQGYAKSAVRRVFENSIMLEDGAAHERTREILKPAVGRLALHEAAGAVYRIWVQAVEDAAPAVPDVYELSQRTTFTVAANVLTGFELGAETNAARPHFERLIQGIMAPLPIRVPFGRLDRALRARTALERLLAPRVVAARRREPQGLLGQLAHHRDADGTELSVDQIVQHLLLLAWAGYDTTASAASWMLHVLAQRSDWQDRLRQELLSGVGADGTRIESSRDLPELDWFLLEIERMYPSALFFPRIALQDVEIGGHLLPQGSVVFYTPYMSHRDPASFDYPDAFDPERWSPERGTRRASPSKLFGFGGGPRVCLGKAFAKLQLKLALHAILARYRIYPDPTCRSKITALPVHHPVGSRIRLAPLVDATRSTQ